MSDPEDPDQPGENLVKDADFESNPDLTLQLEEPTVCGQWVAYKDQYETNVVTIGVSDDTTQGKVAAITGKTSSCIRLFYLSVLMVLFPLGFTAFHFWDVRMTVAN